MTDSIAKIINDTNVNGYRRNLCDYIKYSNCLMQAMETRKRRNFNKDDGMYGLLGEHMDKMVSDICKDSETMGLDNFKIRDMDREIRRIRHGITKKLKKCSPGEMDSFIKKYFDKALKSGRKIDEFCDVGRKTDYGSSIGRLLEQYDKISKCPFKF